jgi:hypothetical protein
MQSSIRVSALVHRTITESDIIEINIGDAASPYRIELDIIGTGQSWTMPIGDAVLLVDEINHAIELAKQFIAAQQ